MEQRRLGKRPHSELTEVLDDVERVYKFKILLPNGTSMGLTFHEPRDEMQLEEFVESLKHEYFKTVKSEGLKPKRRILWKNKEIFLEDVFGNKIRTKFSFKRFKPNKCHLIKLHDGAEEIDTFENMWDLTPDTDMLMELPEEYNFESALADLIDNSLQALWSNGPNERRLVRVTIDDGRISIFDTGPGMDGNDESSIVKWGKMGASLHRSSKGQAIGGKPPYLTPFFGMFGYGGAMASMHLGRHALVSSKTKESKKVYTLHLEREALLSRSGEKTWKTDGGIRDPLEDEISLTPHGSFTKVEIFKPKMRWLGAFQLKCRLKDIYFPYIQCDELSVTGKTTRPIEFLVNGDDLAETEGGEAAITNLLSCNGPEFVLQLRFSIDSETTPSKSLGSRRALQEANARLKCVYFPIVEGKESIDRILEKLEAEGCGVAENYDTFCRTSIRRLGRLLPDARWGRLPFMEPRQRKGDKAQVLKRCCLRVKCFVETDAGFNPTPSKTDLAHHHPYTIALKNFGNKPLEKDKDINVEINRGKKSLSHSQLEKEYEDWIFQMHDGYDEEVVCGEDPPVLVISPHNKKGLGISSDVLRVHKVIRRKGVSWESGQNIKVLKGAPGCHKNNLYATLEYILLEGFQGDVGGEARLICRPLDVSAEKGCLLEVDTMNASLEIQDSLSFPISVIDSGKCQAMGRAEWECQLEKLRQKAPSSIDILNAQQCRQLDINGVLPFDVPVSTGHVTPKEIVAVVRPVSFNSSSASKILDQKYIIKDDLEMAMEITYSAEDKSQQERKHIYGQRIRPSSRKGFNGLYIFSVGSKVSGLFESAGIYTFLFSVVLKDSSSRKCEKRVIVKPVTRFVAPGPLHHVKALYPRLEKELRPGDVIEDLLLEMFDASGNHVKKGTEVHLNADGFRFQDNKGSKRQVDDKGGINLSGLLKVIGGYGQSVSLSVVYDERTLLMEKFQVVERMLRVVSTVPDCCPPGHQLENIVFEIVNSEGGVDETIHDDMKFGCSHALNITPELSGMDDETFQYTFHHGRCVVPVIRIPRVQGIFSFRATHSHHPELCLKFKVNIELQTPKKEMGSLTECDGVVQSQRSNGNILLLQDLPYHDPKLVETFMESVANDGKELENDVLRLGELIGNHEKNLVTLHEQKETIEQGIYDLQASIEPQSPRELDYRTNGKEAMVQRIEVMGDTAASIFCSFSKAIQSLEAHDRIMQDIVGVVALLGTVNSNKLSRIFSEYLGEDHMLAVVCKSYTTANALERYRKNGEVDRDHAFHAVANAFGKSISGRFLVICLEDISPYTGGFIGNDPQRKLALRDPVSPTGKFPTGFLGYAVNMINVDEPHLYIRTSKGHGLRETLFFLLFGKLQVYETREHMKHAHSSIKHGAVSLDGGIMKGNGVLSLGYGKQKGICFPVITSEVDRQVTIHTMDVQKQIEDKKLELKAICDEMEKETKAHTKAKEKFKKKRERLGKFMEEKVPLLRSNRRDSY